MENRELTNISFKKAMNKVIDKLLKHEAPTPVPKEIDDFETLNSEIFESVMDNVVESIPESGGGGEGSFIAHITMDPQTENYTSDKTAAEIYEAYSNGTPCYAYWFSEDFSDSDIAIPLMTASMVEDKDDPSKTTYEIIFAIFTGEFDIYVTITGANVKVEMEEMYDKFLPEVDADDNGSVLTVVEGSWNKAAPASGSFIVTLTKNGPAQYTADKTIEEIYQTWKNDPSVYIYDSDEENYYPVVAIYRNGNQGSYTYTLLAMFIGIEYSNGAATLQQYKAMYDSSYGWSVTGSGNPLLPGASVNDEGKILKVVNRTWTASNAPTGGGLIVDFDAGHLTADKTAEEIYTAFVAGSMVMVKLGEVYTFVVDAKTRQEGYDITCAKIFAQEGDRMTFASISYTDKSGEAGWHLNTYSRSFLPGVNEDDDGKILKVVEGSWTVVSPN